MLGAETEKARLPRFSLVMGTESEIDYLSYPGMVDRCMRLVR